MTPPSGPALVLAVRDLVGRVRHRLETGFTDVWVEGEVSNFKQAASGHLYFSLKDDVAQLRVVMYRLRAQKLRFRIEDGMVLLARGGLTVYEPRGDLQFAAQDIELRGQGALMVALEQLKTKLGALGLFDPARKRPLPVLPRRVGLVTSRSGAALHDMLNVLGRRQASLRVLLAPVRVQGEGAGAEIARAIDRLSGMADIDVIIVGRGGGSIEDLWSFNEEVVAHAIHRSRPPVISAVGHEIDFTIADLVADLRAPTPSAAAELVACSRSEVASTISALRTRLRAALASAIVRRRIRIAALGTNRSLRAVEALPARGVQKLDELRTRLAVSAARTIAVHRTMLGALAHRLKLRNIRTRLGIDRERLRARDAVLRDRMQQAQNQHRLRLATATGRLDALSPLAVLARGYALATTATGQVVTRSADVAKGDLLRVRLGVGALRCRVESTAEEPSS